MTTIIQMNEKTITIILLGLLLLFFGTHLIFQRLLLPAGQPLTGLFQDIARLGQDEKWLKAEKSALELEKAWAKYKYLTALNYAEEDYSLLKDNLVKIRCAIESHNQTETIALSRAGLALWKNFLNFIPEP